MADTVALIVAAGRGERAGGGMPKQYRPLAGRAILRRSCLVFLENNRIDAVRVVINPGDRALYDEAVGDLALLSPVAGGSSRHESCRNGLESLSDMAPESVLIHDAARPLTNQHIIDRVLDGLANSPGAIAAVPVTDTLKRADDAGTVAGTIDREGLWRAQTPQGFAFKAILEAHRNVDSTSLTDDAAVAEAAGMSVSLVEGSEDNIKITREEDFRRAEALLGGGADLRVGSGFDVHRFCEGDHVILCGITIPHDHALQGHSDADVGMHAVTDAIFGALGEGDIGAHFPPSDPQWRDTDSAVFLRYAASRVAARNGAIRYVDLTLICEAPKVAAHRETMRARLAEIISIPMERVGVKATTTEGLGFTGRGEGIAAQATATICL